ncbi:MAG: hypothetical protein Q9174_003366 [Haloplaca sp. 1 TL-2023]
MSVFSHIKVPPLASLYVVDNRLPATADYTPLQASKRYPWTEKEKQVLHVLSHTYQNPAHELHQVFNGFFSEDYRRRARPRRCVWEAMRSQIKRSKKKSNIWWTKTEALALKAQLVRLAKSFNIRLHLVAVGRPTKLNTKRVKRPSSPVPSTPDTSEVDWSTDKYETPVKTSQNTEHRSIARTPSKQQNGLLTPPSSQEKVRQANKKTRAKATRPPIVFRAFNPLSQGLNSRDGFVAGKFSGAAVPPVTPDASFYLQELERHLAWKHRGVTSFVSVSQNLLRVLRHTIRSSGGESGEVNDWQIALIDLSKVTGSLRVPEGISPKRTQSFWGVDCIPASAVLNVVHLTELLTVMCEYKETFYTDAILSSKNTRQARIAIGSRVDRRLTYADGLVIGQLLLFFGIPSRYINHSIQNLLVDWRYPENRASAWKTNNVFVQGYKNGYERISSDFCTPIKTEDDFGSHLKDSVQQSTSPDSSAEPTALLNPNFVAERHNPAEIGNIFADFLNEIEDAAFG